MRADLKTRMELSTKVASNNKRPDVVIRSPLSRQVIIVELAVPKKDRIEDAYERKIKMSGARDKLSEERVESMVFPSGGWRAGLC